MKLDQTKTMKFSSIKIFIFLFLIIGLCFSLNPSSAAGKSYSVDDRVKQFGPVVEKRMKPYFVKAGVTYPPARMAILAFKNTDLLEVYAAENKGEWKFIRSYPVLAASGKLGPKLKQGDYQVPEGVYRLEFLNPMSRFHLSLRVNYPNAFDRKKGREDGRTKLGGDIMIHGNRVSIGCLAMGDEAAEDLFVMAAYASKKGQVPILISPVDFRSGAKDPVTKPAWIKEVYGELRKELANFKR